MQYWLFKNCSIWLAANIAHILNLSLLIGRPVVSLSCTHYTSTQDQSFPVSVGPSTYYCNSYFINEYPLLVLGRNIHKTEWRNKKIKRNIKFIFEITTSSKPTYYLLMINLLWGLLAAPHNRWFSLLVNTFFARSLETNNYVRCLLVDFSYAFPTISHVKLVEKMKQIFPHLL